MAVWQELPAYCGRGEAWTGARLPTRPWKRRPLAAALLLALGATPSLALGAEAAEDAMFDADVLRARGLDPALAEYFRGKPRFAEGRQQVSLSLNGEALGEVEAEFDAQGQLCFSPALLEQARLQAPSPDEAEGVSVAPACYDFVGAWPQTQVQLNPNLNRVALLVPTAAILSQPQEEIQLESGGVGGMLNYDLSASSYQGLGSGSRSLSLDTEAGVNIGDWIVRSRQFYYSNNGQGQFSDLGAYAQRSFVSQRARLQLGVINVDSPLFAGGQLLGAQWTPESGLEQRGPGARVEGVANSVARVEVRQAGVLIHIAQVPAGPFSFDHIRLNNRHVDLEVTVAESDGGERRFTVPAASLALDTAAPLGYSLAMGRLRDVADDGEEPLLLTGSGSWALGQRAQGTLGALGTPQYQALGLGADVGLGVDTTLSARGVASMAREEGVFGHQSNWAMSTRMSEAMSASLSASFQSEGYRDLGEATTAYGREQAGQARKRRTRAQYSASLGWSHQRVGSFRLSYSTSRSFDGHVSSRWLGSWGKSFKRMSLNLNVENGRNSFDGRRYQAWYLNFSLPLEKRRLNSTVRSSGGDINLNTSVSETVNEYWGYQLSAEQSRRGTGVSANVNVQPRYASARLGVGQNYAGRHFSAGLRGGLAFHRDGVTASPAQIQDSFGVLSTGKVSGVRVNTPGGAVWTDAGGRAVIPSLTAYDVSRLEVDVKSLPRTVELKNGYKELKVSRGAVRHVEFDVFQTRRVLLEVKDSLGQPLSAGGSVLTADNRFVTIVVEGGKVFLDNAEPGQVLTVTTSNGNRCQLDFALPETADEQVFYEQLNAACRAET
ncbi:fimbria/pilus outer membrane usher protein [Chromobacterium haemolyticum]|uniref:fimbria/pilus outer membrane usher protein n=1 Tax=Chromobacterium haemolyticum TaxID=394935 RepID=UPI001131432E|nr:fimbria/pilus outer membrane usher protein [Chromobacterium haemolyticum]